MYDYLLSKGIAAEAVVFQFVNVTKQYEPVYSANGSWAGQRFTGYRLFAGFHRRVEECRCRQRMFRVKSLR